MAVGTYKINVAIMVTYQAINSETGLTIDMDIYNESHTKEGATQTMTEVVATGRYYKEFTPDAEGEWIITMENNADGSGKVVKSFAVAGHDVDSIGDAIATIDGEISTIDTEVGDIATAVGVIDGEIETIDTNVDDIETLVTTADGKLDTIDSEIATIDTEVGVIDGLHDVPGEDGAPDATIRDVVGKKTDTVAGTSIIALQKQLLADTGSTGNIRGADDDDLKSLSDQIDAVSSPAMVG